MDFDNKIIRGSRNFNLVNKYDYYKKRGWGDE